MIRPCSCGEHTNTHTKVERQEKDEDTTLDRRHTRRSTFSVGEGFEKKWSERKAPTVARMPRQHQRTPPSCRGEATQRARMAMEVGRRRRSHSSSPQPVPQHYMRASTAERERARKTIVVQKEGKFYDSIKNTHLNQGTAKFHTRASPTLHHGACPPRKGLSVGRVVSRLFL